jgi:hypothetical protein
MRPRDRQHRLVREALAIAVGLGFAVVVFLVVFPACNITG